MSLPETYRILYASTVPGGKPRFEQVPFPIPGDNEVVVKMEFAPINPSDILAMHGLTKYYEKEQYPVGQEGSGTVISIGTNLKVPHKIGDRVHVAYPGTYGEYIKTDSDNLSPILGDLSFEEAASHFINPGTTYIFGQRAKQGGHKAAIHTAGSSAMGRMLIRYFKHLGIKLINVVRNEKYIEELKAEGADYVLNSQDPDFEVKLKELAEKESATIAFEAVSGAFAGKIVAAQPRDSICYVYGVLEDFRVRNVHTSDLFKNKLVGGILIFECIEAMRRKGELAQFYNDIHAYLPTIFSSKIQKVFKLDDLEEALAYYEKNSSKGKILFKLSQ